MRLALALVIAFSVSGCLASQPKGNETLSPTFSFLVSPGTWVLLQPALDANGNYHLTENRTFDYGSPGARISDDYECSTATSELGWVDEGLPTTYHGYGALWSGFASGPARSWQATQYAYAGGKVFLGVYSSRVPGHPSTFLLVGADQVGTFVKSEAKISAHQPVNVLATGPYWCLASLSALDGGNFVASNTYAQAENMNWTKTTRNGILVRLQVVAQTVSVHVTSPTGQQTSFSSSNATTVDETFCSTQAGTWNLGLDELHTGTTVNWQFVVSVFDVKLPDFDCRDEWIPSPMSMQIQAPRDQLATT